MKILVTGSTGLIGSEAATYFGERGHSIYGIDNNQRMTFFGAKGDTRWNLQRLQEAKIRYEHHDADIRDRKRMLDLYRQLRPDVTIHCAAQPSHDLAAEIPFDDFDTNAVGTMNLLEATRQFVAESPFILASTNKVYGDAPNELSLIEKDLRYDYADPEFFDGIDENMRIDQTLHSLFGASKVAADVMTQEYGRYFNMPTVCFRGGCLTGPSHSGVELHGFLSYLIKVAIMDDTYTIYGYKGKQVRDQIHSEDVVCAFESYIQEPRAGEVYNLGGGRENSASVLECIRMIEQSAEVSIDYILGTTNRTGDHICYISNLRKFRQHYPKWELRHSLKDIITSMLQVEREKED